MTIKEGIYSDGNFFDVDEENVRYPADQMSVAIKSSSVNGGNVKLWALCPAKGGRKVCVKSIGLIKGEPDKLKNGIGKSGLFKNFCGIG